jgi:regulator of nucleoside diphosphate kinase
MMIFPNRGVTHRDDVVESVKKEFRKEVNEARVSDVVDQMSWDVVDRASWDSFPASDAPPWTLGYIESFAPADVGYECIACDQPNTEGDETMKNRPLVISDVDRRRLETLIDSERMNSRTREDHFAALEAELRRARVVPADKVPPDAVTMNSVVRLRDLNSDEVMEYELVYPRDADMTLNRISVLAPVGTAILGYRLGDVIEWPVPAGLRRLRVEELLYQPESAAALHRETGSGSVSPAVVELGRR